MILGSNLSGLTEVTCTYRDTPSCNVNIELKQLAFDMYPVAALEEYSHLARPLQMQAMSAPHPQALALPQTDSFSLLSSLIPQSYKSLRHCPGNCPVKICIVQTMLLVDKDCAYPPTGH